MRGLGLLLFLLGLAGCDAPASVAPVDAATSGLCAAPSVLLSITDTPEGPRVEQAMLVTQEARPMPETGLESGRLARIVDEAGLPLATFDLPRTDLRSVAFPGEEGLELSLDGLAPSTVLVPWPEGARAIEVNGALVQPECATRVTKADGTALAPVALHESGPASNRFDLVILGDGYQAADEQKFTDDAQRVVDALLATEPYKTYRSLVNVWRVYASSNEAGAGSGGVGKDTFYGCFFGGQGIARVILCDALKVRRAVLDTVPEADATLVMVNDARYGGMNTPHYAALSNGPDLPSVLVHELGHRLNLGDEYTYTDYVPQRFDWPNCSNSSTMTPWEYWRERDDRVAAFQGCGLERQYRSTEEGCIMLSSSSHDFCPICREQLVLELHAAAGSLQGDTTPSSAQTVRLNADAPTTFSVRLPQGTEQRPLGYTYTWMLDGQVLPTTTAELVFDRCVSGTLELVVEHSTEWTRPDNARRLRRNALWRVTCG